MDTKERIVISLIEKVEVLGNLDKRMSTTAFCRSCGVNASTSFSTRKTKDRNQDLCCMKCTHFLHKSSCMNYKMHRSSCQLVVL